jgi:hypothetical protein
MTWRRISIACVGVALFSVCIASLFSYYVAVGDGAFRRAPAVAALTNTEMLATFGDGCTACLQVGQCVNGYGNRSRAGEQRGCGLVTEVGFHSRCQVGKDRAAL